MLSFSHIDPVDSHGFNCLLAVKFTAKIPAEEVFSPQLTQARFRRQGDYFGFGFLGISD